MTETSETMAFSLPPSLNHDALRDLANFLTANRGESVSLDGENCSQIGAQAAQTLVVAAQTWASERAKFQICDPSGSIADSFAVLGLSDIFTDILTSDGVAP